jgi:hypothetical protein
MCSCLPFLRPIISRIFPRLLSSGSTNRYGANKTTLTNLTGTRNMTRHTQLFTQDHDKDYDTYSINVLTKSGNHSNHSSLGGIEVTTEMSVMQEATPTRSNSDRKLVIDAL